MINMEKLLTKVKTLNKSIVEIFKFNEQAENLIPIITKINEDNKSNKKLKKESTNREDKLQLIKQKVDFREVDYLFDDIVDE